MSVLTDVEVRVPDFDRVETWALTQAQTDGRYCVSCGGGDGPMVPVAYTVEGHAQLFSHPRCWDLVLFTRNVVGSGEEENGV